ncbi:hypothetical protein ACPAY5_00690 [Staphylococcus caledonicus]|uniref:hypothetical protein n=1 Tax=Staphylococcus caledonicus TaxID=2741333 RepID=UPI003C2BF2E5
MSKSKKYFFISVVLLIISFYFNTFNPFLSQQITSVKYLLIACSIVNVIILIVAIIFSDKAIKHLDKQPRGWLRICSKLLPFIILIVILFHIYASISTFGVLS